MKRILCVLVVLAGCAPPDDSDPDDGTAPDCDTRTGGAMIHFEVGDESLRLWMTDDAFVDAAIAHVAASTTQVPNFLTVVAGRDCDAQWGFHVDPADAEWADFTIELCDGSPSYVDANLDDWIDQVGQYCPWSGRPVAVDDRR